MKKINYYLDLGLALFVLINSSIAQQVSLTGKVINPDEKPIKKVFVYLANNPTLYCYSDSLGNFSLININTSVTEVRQDKIISFENRKLSLYANNQSISVDVITIDGRPIMNIVNLNKRLGTFGLYPEAYISDLPKAIYIVRARVGSTFRSFKIQNIIPSGFPQGITQYDINNIADNSFSEPKSMTKSGVLDTLVLVHDFYKSRRIPIDSYSIHYDSIHLSNFSDYSIAEDFEPSVTYMFNGYANFTNILSADSVQFIIDYDTLSILKGDLKVITIPVDKIESLDNSINFISGLHFEPSGTQFLQPVQVTVLIKDSIPEDLVVFQCNDQGETYFIPYESHELTSGGYCIIFHIYHFSSIGIGTGEIPTKSDPSEFTTSDQFISYGAKYYEEEVPEDFFTNWFNNVVAPMINNISTIEELTAAMREFTQIGRYYGLLGFSSFEQVSFYDLAMGMFYEKMDEMWNACIVEYNGLDDYCLKREILYIASQICKLSSLFGGLYEGDMNVFGNGEYYNLATRIEFSTPVKHLEVGESYVVVYNLKSFSGNATIPEVVSWSSSNPSVATINSDGKVTAKSRGESIIKGKICDIENTLKVEVGGANCEEEYCYNECMCCYSGTYKCTGVLSATRKEPYNFWPCGYRTTKMITRYTMVGNLGFSDVPGYLETIHSVSDYNIYHPYAGTCEDEYSMDTNQSIEYDAFICLGKAYFQYKPYVGAPEMYGYLKGDFLILDVKQWYGNYVGYITTKFYCNRIDK